MNDFLGNEIKVGDHVFYGTTSRYSEFALVKVTRLTAKTVKGEMVKSNRSSSFLPDEVTIADTSHCVIVPYEDKK